MWVAGSSSEWTTRGTWHGRTGQLLDKDPPFDTGWNHGHPACTLLSVILEAGADFPAVIYNSPYYGFETKAELFCEVLSSRASSMAPHASKGICR